VVVCLSASSATLSLVLWFSAPTCTMQGPKVGRTLLMGVGENCRPGCKALAASSLVSRGRWLKNWSAVSWGSWEKKRKW